MENQLSANKQMVNKIIEFKNLHKITHQTSLNFPSAYTYNKYFNENVIL